MTTKMEFLTFKYVSKVLLLNPPHLIHGGTMLNDFLTCLVTILSPHFNYSFFNI